MGILVVLILSKDPNSKPVESFKSLILIPGCIDLTFIKPLFLLNSKMHLGVITNSGPPLGNPNFFLPFKPPGYPTPDT